MMPVLIMLPSAISIETFDSWLVGAAPGDEIVFAEGPSIPRAAPIWAHSIAMVEDGAITVVHRRGEGTTWRYCARRCAVQRQVGEAIIRSHSPAMDPDDPESRVLRQLRLAEKFDRPCPTNAELAAACRLGEGDAGRKRASYLIGKLVESGRIRVALHGLGQRSIAIIRQTRVVEPGR